MTGKTYAMDSLVRTEKASKIGHQRDVSSPCVDSINQLSGRFPSILSCRDAQRSTTPIYSWVTLLLFRKLIGLP